MRTWALLFSLLVLGSGLAVGQGDGGKKDPKAKAKEKKPDKKQLIEQELKKLQGTWRVLRYDSPNERLSKVLVAEGQVVFSGNQMQTKTKGLKFAPRSFTLDPTLTPKTIDFAGGGTKEQGVYEWMGETLRLAVGEPDKSRPGDFSGGLIVLKKELEK